MQLLEISLDGPSLLRLKGEVDTSNAGELWDAFAAIEGPISLDMSELRFIDSTGVGVLVRRMKTSDVLIVHKSEAVARVLRIMNLRVDPGGRLVPVRYNFPRGDP